VNIESFLTIEAMVLGAFALLGGFFLYVARAYVDGDKEWKKTHGKQMQEILEHINYLRQNCTTREETREMWKDLAKCGERITRLEERLARRDGRQGG
jgi:hypothetical protein